MKIGILTGTRPDIIKMAPIYWEAKNRGHQPVLIHTSFHFPYHLFEGSYRDLDIPFPPHYLVYHGFVKNAAMRFSKLTFKLDERLPLLNLTDKGEKIISKLTPRIPNLAHDVGKSVIELNKLFKTKLKDLDILLVHGDTLPCMAASIAAHFNLIPVGHVEAGLRTGSREPFPEQTDTRTADVCSDLHFAATEENKRNLENEWFPKDTIFVVGNTVVDAVKLVMKKDHETNRRFFEKRGFDFSKKLVYVSCHRRETLIHEKRFRSLVDAILQLAKEDYQILWSVRPGTAEAFHRYGLIEDLKNEKDLILMKYIPYWSDIIYFISKCRFVVTDSGSIQEETAALHVPTVTVRYVTDRPESVKAGVNVLAPPKSAKTILDAIKKVERNNQMMRKKKNPYGDGNSSKMILDIIEKRKGKMIKWEHLK